MSEWICMDCTAEFQDTSHAWVKATRVTRSDGTAAWLVGPEPEDPDADDAFDGWLDAVRPPPVKQVEP